MLLNFLFPSANRWPILMLVVAILAFQPSCNFQKTSQDGHATSQNGNEHREKVISPAFEDSGPQERERLRQSRALVAQFVQSLANVAATKNQLPQPDSDVGDTSGEAMAFFQSLPTTTTEPDPILENLSDESLSQVILLAREAESLGMVVNDLVILKYLDRVCAETVPQAEYESILKTTTGGRMSFRQLLDQLRLELLAANMWRLTRSGLESDPPGRTADYYLRLSRTVRVEAVASKVEELVDQVRQTPTDEDLQLLYESGKDRFSSPNLMEPGFKRRRRVAFQYFKADYGAFRDMQMGRITPEEIKDYYNEHRETFRAPQVIAIESPAPAYLPLAKVEDRIRRELAHRPTMNRMDEALRAASSEVQKYSRRVKQWQVHGADESKPTAPPWKAIALQNNLTYHETPLLDRIQILDHQLGQAVRNLGDPGFDIAFRFNEFAFEPNRPIYQTEVVELQRDNSRIAFWKIDETEQYVPDFVDIRDEVIRAWKLSEALALAASQARQRAEVARKGSKTLRELYGEQAIETNDFTWLSPHTASISDVDGIHNPGIEFMRTAFSLEADQIALATNQFHSVYYVVRLTGESVGKSEGRLRFLDEKSKYFLITTVAQQEQREFFSDWFNQVQSAAGPRTPISITSRETRAWQSFLRHLYSPEPNPEVLRAIASAHDGTQAALWAEKMAGDLELAQGIQLLYENRDEAMLLLARAKESYQGIIGAKDAHLMLLRRAKYGLAVLHESLGELPIARKLYQEIVKEQGTTAIGHYAVHDLERLSAAGIDEFYRKFEAWSTKQPEAPNFSFPALNEIE